MSKDTVTKNKKPVNAEAAPNPFDPDNLRLPSNYDSTLGVKKILTVVPCRKPKVAPLRELRHSLGEPYR